MKYMGPRDEGRAAGPRYGWSGPERVSRPTLKEGPKAHRLSLTTPAVLLRSGINDIVKLYRNE